MMFDDVGPSASSCSGDMPRDRRIDRLRHQRAVVPPLGAPVAAVAEAEPPDAALRAVDVFARHVLRAALVVARLRPLADAVRTVAVLGLGAARIDPARQLRPERTVRARRRAAPQRASVTAMPVSAKPILTTTPIANRIVVIVPVAALGVAGANLTPLPIPGL